MFSSILGNETAKTTLTRLLAEKTLPQALLFSGPEGVGKSLFARTVACALMGPKAAARVESGNHPDLHQLYPEGKALLHPIESIRALIEQASYPPFEAPVKVFILHEAHRMLSTSSNALLKILEEPQADTYFFLLTSQADALLATLTSRLRKISFLPLPDQEIERFVQEKWHKDPQEARRIALFAQGSLARASRFAEQEEEDLQELFTLSLPEEYGRLLTLCSSIEKRYSASEEEEGKPVDDLLEKIFAWQRDLLLIKHGIDARHLIHVKAKRLLEERAQEELPSLEEGLQRLLLMRSGLERHIPLRILLETLFYHRNLPDQLSLVRSVE